MYSYFWFGLCSQHTVNVESGTLSTVLKFPGLDQNKQQVRVYFLHGWGYSPVLGPQPKGTPVFDKIVLVEKTLHDLMLETVKHNIT